MVYGVVPYRRPYFKKPRKNLPCTTALLNIVAGGRSRISLRYFENRKHHFSTDFKP